MVAPIVFQTLENQRKRLVEILGNTPEADLEAIPDGFRNNIWWNAAHILVVQQLLCYKLSNLPLPIDASWVTAYAKGTFPGALPGEEERQKVREQLLDTVPKLKAEYQAGQFGSYTPYTTSAGVTLRSIEDGILFNLYHEGLHLGAILSLQKALK